MNNRIKLLAEQSGAWEYFNDGDEKSAVMDSQALSNFAELIIQECASICELNGASYKYSFNPAKARVAESTSKYCGALINRSFGIESIPQQGAAEGGEQQ